MKVRSFLLSALIASASPASGEARERFVLVQPIERTFDIRDTRKDVVTTDLLSVDGRPAYRLQCRSPKVSSESVPELESDYYFSWSGDFECRLISATGAEPSYTTLFTESSKQIRDWLSRARFFSQELREPCGSRPELGRRRSFKLRGMKITLEIVDPKFDQSGELSALKLKLSVVRDAGAWRRIAEITPLPNPMPKGCDASHFPPIISWSDR